MHRLYLITVILLGTAAVHAYAVLPGAGPVRDEVETAEQSFFYDQQGRLIFEQLIFWQGENVVAWRMVKDGEPCIRRDWKHGGYVCLWIDKETFREVRSKFEMVTHEQHDREVAHRELLPVCYRRELTRDGQRK